MALQKLSQFHEFEEIIQDKAVVLLLKNSLTCSISEDAYVQFEQLAQELGNEPVYYLNVQEARPLSNEIAEKFSIKHESPQVLLFKNGEVVWHTSHWKIKYDVLNEQLVEAKKN